MTRLSRWLMKIAGQNDEELVPRTDLEIGLAAIAENGGGGGGSGTGMRVINLSEHGNLDLLDITPREILAAPLPAMVIAYYSPVDPEDFPSAYYFYVISVQRNKSANRFEMVLANLGGETITFKAQSWDSFFEHGGLA